MTYSFPTADWLMHTEEVGPPGWDLMAPLRLDFSRPFMPDALARTAALGFLAPDERRKLNQIRGNAHLTIVALLDSLIARPRRGRPAVDAPVHRDLLDRFRGAFVAGFGSACEVIGPLAALVGRHGAASRLARVLLAEQVTWMAKRHLQAAALNARTLDPGFVRLLAQHWVERGRPAAETSPSLERCALDATRAEIDAGVEGYRRLCAGLSEVMQAQARLDLAALERACDRTLTAEAREQTLLVQHHAYWWAYVGCGVTHPRFAAGVRRLAPEALAGFDGLIAALP